MVNPPPKMATGAVAPVPYPAVAGMLEAVLHADGGLVYVRAARRARCRPVVIPRRGVVFQHRGDHIKERLPVEVVGDAALEQLALQSVRAAGGVGQGAGAFAAAHIGKRSAYRPAPARLEAHRQCGVLVFVEAHRPGRLAVFVVLQAREVGADAMVAEAKGAAQAGPRIGGMRARRADVGERRADVVRAAKKILVALVLRGCIERPGLPLHAHRQVVSVVGLTDVILGLVGTVLHPALEPGDLRRLVLDRVRRALMEARRVVVADADMREHVARRDEVAAGEAEDLLDLAILLVDRVHVAELHRAEAAGKPEEGVAVGPHAGAGIEFERLLDLPDAFESGPPELSFAPEAEVRVLRIDRNAAARRRAGATARAAARAANTRGRGQVGNARAGLRRVLALRPDHLRIQLAVELQGTERLVTEDDLRLRGRRDE